MVVVMDGPANNPLLAEVDRLRALLAQRDRLIAMLTQQRDEYQLEKLRLQVRLAQLLKQTYGPRADRLRDPAQMLLEFARHLDTLPADPQASPATDEAATDTGSAEAPSERRAKRRLRTRGRRDIGDLKHLPMIEKTYELTGNACLCPTCQQQREKIGEDISYTVEYLPGSFIRIKHIQHKYACHACEKEGFNPNIERAGKTDGSPIDTGMPGPGLLAYIATSKYADYRVQGEAVSKMREGPSWPGCRTRPQTSSNCGDQESSWETSSPNGAARPRQVRFAKTNASEPLKTCRNSIQTMSKPERGGCSGRSVGDTCLRPTRHPALRRRECESGSDTEPWNLSSRCQGRNPSGQPARTRVPMRDTGAERLVVAMRGV